jgi:hypothetical protein
MLWKYSFNGETKIPKNFRGKASFPLRKANSSEVITWLTGERRK